MSIEKLIIPENYHSSLSIFDTQIAIKIIKDTFEQELAKKLNLRRVSAPLFVSIDSGLNDNLSGVERPVGFDVNGLEVPCEIVHSLAKWKRMALKQYDFYVGNGLYTDMNAIRRDEELDNLHSVYVDQWDWEKVIEYQDRTEEYLKKTVVAIMQALKDTERVLHHRFPELKEVIEEEVYFITSEELLQKYPTLSAKEREDAIVKEHHTVFIQQIGAPLSDGKPHDGRAPDYDDWSLNGDLIV